MTPEEVTKLKLTGTTLHFDLFLLYSRELFLLGTQTCGFVTAPVECSLIIWRGNASLVPESNSKGLHTQGSCVES